MALRHFGLISDTHGYVHPDLFSILEGVELILHAGDVGGERVLDELEAIAPVLAVCGNVDLRSARLPEVRVEALPFGTAVITHSHLLPDRQRSPQGLARHFRGHQPRRFFTAIRTCRYCARHDGIWVVNPGPAGRPRFSDRPSVVRMSWDAESDAFDFDLRGLPRQEK